MAGTETAERPSALDLERQAADADAAADGLEEAALHRGEDIDPAAVDQHRTAARGLRFRAQAAARRAERAAEAARLAELAQLNADITEYADGLDPAALADALERVRDAAAEVRRLAAGHDAKVRELAERARVLGAGGSAPGGPRAEHGHVAYGGPALVTAGAVTLRAVGDEAGHLPAVWAAHDDPRLDLVPVPALVVRRQARRPGHVLRTRAGAVLTTDDIRPFGQQLAAGDVTELSPGEVDQYMAGRQ